MLVDDVASVPHTSLQKQRWKLHTKIGVFISSHNIAPGFWCLQPTEMSGLLFGMYKVINIVCI